MFRDLFDYPTVLPPHRYETLDGLCSDLAEYVIAPAERRALDIEVRRAELLRRG
jgi:hypothetical protein